MSKFNLPKTTKSKDEWLTPPYIIEALGPFDLDPCAPNAFVRPWNTAAKHYSGHDGVGGGEAVDGLTAEWKGRVWLNPPYMNQAAWPWIDKLSEHGSGIALIFARTETINFHSHVWNRAHYVFFFQGRLRFYHAHGEIAESSADAPSCLVCYSAEDAQIIKEAIRLEKIKGKMIRL